MKISTIMAMVFGVLQAKYICDVLFYALGFYKRDEEVARVITLGEEITCSLSFKINIVMCIAVYIAYEAVYSNIGFIEGADLEFNRLTFYVMVCVAIIVRFMQGIKDRLYKNRQYNKICDTLDRVTLLMDSIENGWNNMGCAKGFDEKYKILHSLYDVLERIKNELIYNKSISGIYKVVNVADELNKNNKTNENMSALIKEIDKINAYNELSNKQLNSLYKTLRNQVLCSENK